MITPACARDHRGSVCGFKPAPCIKIATSSEKYRHMQGDMDLNCGAIVIGDDTIEAVGRRIFEELIAVASGKKTRNEEFEYGDNEFMPWQVGAITSGGWRVAPLLPR